MTCVAFGPIAYDVRGVVLPVEWRAFRVAPRGDARLVEVRIAEGNVGDDAAVVVAPGSPPTVTGWRFRAERRADIDVLEIDAVSSSGLWPAGKAGLVAGLAALVTLDAPARSLLVLHAAGVSAAAGVALLVAPPGTGKSTRVAAAGTRAFARNAVLVSCEGAPRAWPMPLAGAPDDAVVAPEPARVCVVAALERADVARVEPLEGARATMAVLRAAVRPSGDDSQAAVRARLALEFAATVPVVRLGSPPDASYLAVLDRFCNPTGER